MRLARVYTPASAATAIHPITNGATVSRGERFDNRVATVFDVPEENEADDDTQVDDADTDPFAVDRSVPEPV